jgi:hypothetical protein
MRSLTLHKTDCACHKYAGRRQAYRTQGEAGVDDRMIEQDRKCTYKRKINARSHNHCCRAKARSITYSMCVSVALVNQHDKCMGNIILSPDACLAIPYFSTSFHKRHDSRKKKKKKKKKKEWYRSQNVFFFHKLCLKHFSF